MSKLQQNRDTLLSLTAELKDQATALLVMRRPFSSTGLYVNLKTWQGFGQDRLALDKAGQNALYLHQKWTRVPIETEDTDEVSSASPLLSFLFTLSTQQASADSLSAHRI